MINNYRPVSILPILAKFFGKCVKTRTLIHIERQKWLLQIQFGFWKKITTIQAMITIMEKILDNMDGGKKTKAVLYDFSMALDSIT